MGRDEAGGNKDLGNYINSVDLSIRFQKYCAFPNLSTDIKAIKPQVQALMVSRLTSIHIRTKSFDSSAYFENIENLKCPI